MQVRLELVTKRFQEKRSDVTAVDRLNLTIASGRLTGLLGPSGCGKSTTLFMIAGIYPLTEGKICFNDTDVTNLPPEKRGVGMVFQNYALYPHLTVRQNIAFPLDNSKVIKAQLKKELREENHPNVKALIEHRVNEAARLVEIEDYLDRRPGELSGGQQQRVAIARAIVKRPSILLLDEPLSNLDARLRLQTREEIRRIQRKTGITTIFVTHDQEEALNICDEIVILKDGVLQQLGEPQNVYDNPANRFVAEFLGSTPVNLLDARIHGGSLFFGGQELLAGLRLADGNVTAGIRPENLLICETGGLAATVLRTTRLGGVTTIEATLADSQTVRCFQDNRMHFKAGDVIRLEPLENAVYLFDANGEKVAQC